MRGLQSGALLAAFAVVLMPTPAAARKICGVEIANAPILAWTNLCDHYKTKRNYFHKVGGVVAHCTAGGIEYAILMGPQITFAVDFTTDVANKCGR